MAQPADVETSSRRAPTRLQRHTGARVRRNEALVIGRADDPLDPLERASARSESSSSSSSYSNSNSNSNSNSSGVGSQTGICAPRSSGMATNTTPDSLSTKSGSLRGSSLGGSSSCKDVQADGAADKETAAPDAFESTEDHHEEVGEVARASIELDDLPIELISLTDSFVESLFARVHSAPPNIDNLTRLFQEFYYSSSSAIQTHLSALATRASRDASPTRPRSSTASRLRAKAASLGSKDGPKLLGMIGGSSTAPAPAGSSAPRPPAGSGAAQQLLTPDELAARKRARRAFEARRLLMEEAVERRLCEGLYDRIYRHRSTQDEAQDEKLRSKTAALALVGIGLQDLGIRLGDDESQTNTPEDAAAAAGKAAAEKEDEIKEWLEKARGCLTRMYEKRYPHGKLNMLKAAHKSIVDTLSHFHPSASADEVMPMLIYTLITMPPENLHVISDARFMQRFRWEPKLAGEAAYCLTNLEAAISFLETVDLSTLREDERPSGPAKGADGVKPDTFPPAYPGVSAPSTGPADTTSGAAAAAVATKPASGAAAAALGVAAAAAHNRRLSDLVNMPAQAVNAASGAVFNTADQGLKTITTSLDASYKFLFGRLVERNSHEAAVAAVATNTIEEHPAEVRAPSMVVPKTLDDARKLVTTPPLLGDGDDDDPSLSGTSSLLGPEDPALPTAARESRRPPAREERMLSLIGGWRQATRDHSADSSRSAASLGRVLFPEDRAAGGSSSATTGNPAVLDSVRSLGSSLNPMARLSGISMIRGFGRTQAQAPAPAPAPARTPSSSTTALAAPVGRFMDVANAGELKVAEVAELLADYRRLAGALRDMGAFETR